MIKKQQKKGADQVKVTFVLPQEEVENKVSVVGDFNSWNPAKNKLIKRTNGTVSSSITVKAGERYAFRYVSEDGTWLNDDEADSFEISPVGTKNSIVVT